MADMRLLILGSSGYIGTHLMRYLAIHTDWQTTGLDKKDGFDLLGDRSIPDIDTYDCIIHLAARTGVRESNLFPHNYMRDNIQMTLNVLNQARKYSIPTLVASSSSVDELKSAYAYSKYAIEQICISQPYKHFTQIFRPFTVYGHFIEDCWRSNMLYGKIQDNRLPDTLFNAHRDYTHVEDVCSAIHILASNKIKGSAEPYEIGYCSPITTKRFLQNHGIKTKNLKFIHADDPSYLESKYTCASPSSLLRLGWKPIHIERAHRNDTPYQPWDVYKHRLNK